VRERERGALTRVEVTRGRRVARRRSRRAAASAPLLGAASTARERCHQVTHTHTRASSESETETPVRLLACPLLQFAGFLIPALQSITKNSTLPSPRFNRMQQSSFTPSLVYSLSSSSESSSESSSSWIASRKGRLAAHNFLPSSPPTCRAAALLYHVNTASSLTTSCS
jgi:hypothetical protein